MRHPRWLLMLAVLATALPRPAQAQKPILVVVDGLPVSTDVPPLLKDGRTLVPFRAIAELLNIDVTWDGATQTVRAADQETSVLLQVGNRMGYRNGVPVTLDVPPVLTGGRVLVPVRFFSEAFGATVRWDGENSTVEIDSAARPMTVTGFYALGDRETSSWRDLFGRDYPAKTQGNTDVVSDLALGWYSLDAKGHLLTRSTTGWQRPDGWEQVLAAAAATGLRTEMVVHVTDGQGTLTGLLADESGMAAAARAIANEARQYDGVNLDLEGLGLSETGDTLVALRARFVRLVRLVAEPLRVSGKRLTLTLHAPNSSYRGYDYQALGEVADRIIIMAYDYGAKPEPVQKVVEAVELARLAVSSDKLVLGISIPGETPDSFRVKVGIAKRYRLSGVALWRLGLVPPELWQELRRHVELRK